MKEYGGQTIQQLLAMKGSHRVDSLVLALEEALGDKPEAELSEPERVVLAVEALEREVNNGGYEQYFSNSSREHTVFLVRALELIDCPKAAAISADAIAVLELPEQFDADTVEQTASELSDESRKQLGECDSRYYANDENIAQRLFSYIEEHQHEIQIQPIASQDGRDELSNTTPCPYCGRPLRSARAKQCRHCRRDWHDPENIKELS